MPKYINLIAIIVLFFWITFFAPYSNYVQIVFFILLAASLVLTIFLKKESYKLIFNNSENFGPCYARNQGIAKANGKFILCLDHDVKLLSNFLENMYKSIRVLKPRIMLAQ